MVSHRYISVSDETAELVPLRELATVLAVAKTGGVTKAARALGYAQPTVTLHLQTVERYIGSALFERNGRALLLTSIGRAVIERGEALLDEAATFRSAVLNGRSHVAGAVRLAAIEPTASLRLPSIIANLARTHPDIDVDVRAVGGPAAIELVRSHAVDFAICSPAHGDKKLRYRPLFDERLALLVPRKHRLAQRKHASLADLVTERLLVSDEGCAFRSLVRSALDAGHVEVALQASFGTLSTLPFGVAAGLGVAVLPCATLRRPLPGTNVIPLRKPTLSLSVGTLVASDRALSDAAKTALEVVTQALLSD